jgi:hypothetical protein
MWRRKRDRLQLKTREGVANSIIMDYNGVNVSEVII